MKTTTALLLVTLSMSSLSYADNAVKDSSSQSQTNNQGKNQEQMKKAQSHAQTKAQTQAAEKRKEVTKEAVSAITETQNALEFLDRGKKSEALDSLRMATGKLEILMARSPQMGFAPFEVSVQTHDVLGSYKDVENIKNQVISMLKDNRVQEARAILSKLSSETRIDVASIPLATYPAAMKDAVKMIDQNKLEEAKSLLSTALSTIAVSETIIPLPLFRAEFFVNEAQKVKVNTKEDKNLVMGLIQAGRDELNMAQVLGYGDKNNFKDVFSRFDSAEKLITAGKVTDVKFSQLKDSIDNLFKAQGRMQAQESNSH